MDPAQGKQEQRDDQTQARKDHVRNQEVLERSASRAVVAGFGQVLLRGVTQVEEQDEALGELSRREEGHGRGLDVGVREPLLEHLTHGVSSFILNICKRVLDTKQEHEVLELVGSWKLC